MALLHAANAESTADARGKAFENVAEYLFTSVGCAVRRNLTSPLQSQQVDLAVAHLGGLGPIPTFFLVECKFWDKPADSTAVGYFLKTCEDRRVALGVMFSRNGVTGSQQGGTAAHSLAFASSYRGTNLVVFDENSLVALQSDAQFVDMLIRAWMQAAATGGIGLP
jgi:hypothetical protein